MADKARQRRRLRTATITSVIVALAGVAITVSFSRHGAVVAAQRAEASKLLALAQARLAEDPTEALALATASLELADTREARLFAVRLFAEAPPAWEVSSEIGSAKIPAFSPDGRHLAVAGHSPVVGVWNENGGPPVRLSDHETSPLGGNRALWASDMLLVAGLYGGSGQQVHVWSLPEGTKLRTIDFGAPSLWQVGPGRLLAETPEGTSLDSFVGGGLLRSWRLPDGEPEVLGRIDASKLGITSSAFEPHGRGWFYTRGSTTLFVSLPLGREGRRLFSHHAATVTLFDRRHLQPDLLALHDESGENRLLLFEDEGPPLTTILPKPGSAPAEVFYTSSRRWLRNVPGEEPRLRLWDTAALPGARPLELRRAGSWYLANATLHPTDRVVVATTHDQSRLTFWPLPTRPSSVVDGYKLIARPVAFSPDGKWLATTWADGRLRLWPLPGSGSNAVRVFGSPPGTLWESLAFDPKGRYLFAVGISDNAWIVPLDGSPARRLDQYSKDTLLYEAVVSPTGRHVATAFGYGKGPKTLRVWDVETGALRLFDLPEPPTPPGTPPATPSGSGAAVFSLAFLDDSTLFTAGHAGVLRWNLETGSHEPVMPTGPTHRAASMWMTDDRKHALVRRWPFGRAECAPLEFVDLGTGAARALGEHGSCVSWSGAASGPSGLVVSGSLDGTIRVARRPGDEPHVLAGHAGNIDRLAVSPDLRWIASTGEDNTLRLWPMPDLDKPPLHTLPHDELLAKLKSLTNLRAVRDPKSATGWTIELGPFPGWKSIPTW